MDALHARKDLQKILDMFKQLEPALEFDDGKLMNKSISRQGGTSNTSGTRDSGSNIKATGAGQDYTFADHLDIVRQKEEQRTIDVPITEVVSQSQTPGSRTETISEIRRNDRHEKKVQKDPYKSKLTRISQERVNSESESDNEQYGAIADLKSPLEKLMDLKMQYGLKKENEDPEEHVELKPKNKFVTFKQSTVNSSAMQTLHDKNGPIQPHVNPKRHLIKPRPDVKEPTFIQKELSLKKPSRLSMNDQEILDNLKERLLTYMGDEKEDQEKRLAKTLKAFGKEQQLKSMQTQKMGQSPSKKPRQKDDQWANGSPGAKNKKNGSTSLPHDFTEQVNNGKKLPRNKSSNLGEGSEQIVLESDRKLGGVGYGLEGPSLADYSCVKGLHKGGQDSNDCSVGSPKSSYCHLRTNPKRQIGRGKSLAFSKRVASIKDKLTQSIRSYQARAGKCHEDHSVDLTQGSQTFGSGRQGFLKVPKSPKSPKSKSIEPKKFGLGQDNAQLYKILRNLNSKNLEGKKHQMKNQLNEAQCRTNKKEDRLRDLYQQLEEITHLNTHEEMASIHADNCIKPQVRSLMDANKCYQHTVQDTLMDADATAGHFDYSSISSILQRKQVIFQKLTVVEKKQKEEENLNAQYLKQKEKLELRNLVEGRQMDLVGQKEQNLDTVAQELAEMNVIENQRKYQVDSLLYHYKKEIQKDQHLMDKIEEEKMVTHKNQEEETKQILHEMLNHLRDIKDLKKGLIQIEEHKQNNAVKEQEIVAAFNTRKEEIDLLNQISQLQKIEEYSNKLDEVGMNGDINDDSQRLKGLDLVDQLKVKLKSSKLVPSFRPDEKKDQHIAIAITSGSASKNHHKVLLSPAKRSETRRPESRVLSSRSSSYDGPPQMHDQDHSPIITQLENYIEHKGQYDQFYQEYYQLAMSVDIQGVVQTYLQSNTKLKYLQNGFKSREQDKMEKVFELQKIEKYYQHLKEEKRLVGDYLIKIGFNQEHKIQDIFNFEHCDPTAVEGEKPKEINSRLPQSIEAMQMYVDGIEQKDITLFQMIVGLKGLINQFYSQFRYQIYSGASMLKVIKKQASNIMVIQDSDEITSLVSRYISGPEKIAALQHEKVGKWGSNAKTGQRRKHSVSKSMQKEESQGSQNSRLSKNSQREALTNNDIVMMSNEPEHQEQKDKYGGKFDEYVEQMGHLTEHLTISQVFLILDIRIFVQILSGSPQKIIFSPKYQKRSKQDPKYQANLNYADFDPVFRRKEFSSIQKNVAKKLQLNRHLTAADKKKLLLNLKQCKAENHNMEPDDDTVEFLHQPKGKGWHNVTQPNVEEEIDINRYHSEASDEEMTKSELAAAQAHINKAFDNLTKDKRDHQIQQQMNELFRQKHHAQEVQRNERFFIMDLKSKIEERYSNLRESFEQEYCDTYKDKKDRMSKTANSHKRTKTLDVGDNANKDMNRDIFSALSTNQSQRVPSKLHNPKYVYQKADEGDEAAVISPVQRLQNFPGRWVNYTTIDEASQLDYKPLKSICFDLDRKKAPLTASIKERIKINKGLTKHTLRNKVSHSLHFRPKTKQLLGEGTMMSTMQSIGDVPAHTNGRPTLSAFQISQPTATTDRVARNLLELSKHAASVRNRFDPQRKSTGAKPISFAWNMQNSGYSQNMNFNTQYGTVSKQSERVNKFVQQKQKKYNTHLYNTYVKRSTNSPARLKDQGAGAAESPTRRYNKNRTKPSLDATQKSVNDSMEY